MTIKNHKPNFNAILFILITTLPISTIIIQSKYQYFMQICAYVAEISLLIIPKGYIHLKYFSKKIFLHILHNFSIIIFYTTNTKTKGVAYICLRS